MPEKAPTAIPGAFNITAVSQGNSKVTLTWDSSTGADTYTVKYGTVSGTYSTTVSTNATSPFEITGLTNGVEYFFMVTAVNGSGQIYATEVSEEAIFYDDFSQLNLGSLWQLSSDPTSYSYVFNPDPSISITSDGNDLVFGETMNNWVGHFLETRQNFDLTNSWVSTEFSLAPLGDGLRYREGGLWILNGAADGWEMFVANGSLMSGTYLSNGSSDQNGIPYDPVAHKFIRIRHQSSDDTIHFEVSPDHAVWSSARIMARGGIPLTQLHFMLYAYTSQNGHGDAGIPIVKFNETRSNAPLN